ncbi:UvrD-helicase domain-containing protein [Avibacterium paragallinarum]
MKKLMIAAAGAGKTTYIVKEALKVKDRKVLITTFTEENLVEIRKKIIQENGFIPQNIKLQGWFSFLLNDCLRPFQCVYRDDLFNKKINFRYWTDGQSGYRYTTSKGTPVYWGEKDFYHYYFDNNMGIYSDKIAKFIFEIHKKNKKLIFERLNKIYEKIFIDEIQDLSGYDLDLVKALFELIQSIICVGDPRQTTYKTHVSRRYKKFSQGDVRGFFIDKVKNGAQYIDDTTLKYSHRNKQIICEISSSLYPEYQATEACGCSSCDISQEEHIGAFYVMESHRYEYLAKYHAVQLRWDQRNKLIVDDYKTRNMGESKGLTLDRVLLYPTPEMLNWFNNQNHILKSQTKSKFYVGLTRARLSLGVVVPDDKVEKLQIKLPIYKPC